MLLSILCFSVIAFNYYNPPVIVNHNTMFVVSKGSDVKAHELYTLYRSMINLEADKVCKEWRSSMLAFVEWGYANGWYPGAVLIKTDRNKEYSPRTCIFV